MYYHECMNDLILTQREKDTLELLVKGYSNEEIAESLVVSVHTVKAHLENIYYKFNVHNKVQAAVHAISCGIIDIKAVS